MGTERQLRQSFNKQNPCPYCGGTSGCRPALNYGILCMRTLPGEPIREGWIRTKALDNGMGSLLVQTSEVVDRFDKQIYDKSKKSGMSEADRACNYQQIRKRMPPLSPLQLEELHTRGLTDKEINTLGFLNWNTRTPVCVSPDTPGVNERGIGLIGASGIGIPAFDYKGRMLGGQILADKRIADKGADKLDLRTKYFFISSRSSYYQGSQNRPGPALNSGEIPIFQFASFKVTRSERDIVVFCEGGLKAAIIAAYFWRHGHHNVVVVGLHGNIFQPIQAKTLITEIYKPKEVYLLPDAGAVVNTSNIPLHNSQIIKHLTKWGYPPKIGWWGQTKKMFQNAPTNNDFDDRVRDNPDVDPFELFECISHEQFYNLHSAEAKRRIDPEYTPRPILRKRTASEIKQMRAAAKKSQANLQGNSPPSIPCQDGLSSNWSDSESGLTGDLPIEFDAEDRISVYSNPDAPRFIQVKTGLGLGKSHTAGQLEPTHFEHLAADLESTKPTQIAYLTNDPLNVTTGTLRNKPVARGRDNGRKQEIVDGEIQWRRASKDEPAQIAANCVRTDLITMLQSYDISTKADTVCSGCPAREQCFAGGTPINYQAERRESLSAPFYVAHPSTLPEEPDQPTVLILDEAQQLLAPIDHHYSLSRLADDFAKLIQLYWHDADKKPIIQQCRDVIEELINYLRENKSKYGVSHAELYPFIQKLPLLTERQIEDLEVKNIDALKADKEFQPKNKVDRKDFRNIKNGEYYQEVIEEAIKTNNVLPWLFYLLRARAGHNIQVVIGANQVMTITHPNYRLINYLNSENVIRVLLLDATADPQYFRDLLQAEVQCVAERSYKRPAEVDVYQVINLGINGKTASPIRLDKITRVKRGIKFLHSGKHVGEITYKDRAHDNQLIHHRDSRGRNILKDADVLIIDGIAAPNLAAAAVQYGLLHNTVVDISKTVVREFVYNTKNPEENGGWTRGLLQTEDPGFAEFYNGLIQTEIEQEIGRLRGNIRSGEKLDVYFLSEYPIDMAVEVVDAEPFLDIATKEDKIEDCIKNFARNDLEITLTSIAEDIEFTEAEVAKTEAWKRHEAIEVTVQLERLSRLGYELSEEELVDIEENPQNLPAVEERIYVQHDALSAQEVDFYQQTCPQQVGWSEKPINLLEKPPP